MKLYSYFIILGLFSFLLINCEENNPTIEHCKKFNENPSKCESEGCDYDPPENYRFGFTAIYKNGYCTALKADIKCHPPISSGSGGNAEAWHSRTTADATYLYWTSSLVRIYSLKSSDSSELDLRAVDCFPRQSICSEQKSKEECLNNYCFWADEAYEAIIENNQCTGWETEPKSLCLNINYLQFPVFRVDNELQVLIIKQISTPENTKVVNGYYSREYGTTYIKANGEKAWSDCILEEDNPICNCPEQ